MNINKANDFFNWYLKLFDDSGNSGKKRAFSQQANTKIWTSDIVTISREAKYARIKNIISSGKPLMDVSFDDFCSDYYFSSLKTSGRGGMYEAKQAYKEAVRGTNDIIEKQDWYAEGVIYTPEIVNSTAFQEHLKSLAEKWASGAELSEAEKRIITSDFNAYENAFAGRSFHKKSAQLNQILLDKGIVLAEDEKIEISLRGSIFTVSGDLSEEKRKAVEEALNSMEKSEKDSYGALFSMHSVSSYEKNISQSQRFLSTSITQAEYLLEQYSGGTIKLQDIFIDSSGQLQGLPEELTKRFEGIDTSGDPILPEKYVSDLAKTKQWIKDRADKVYFETAVKAMLKQGYENLPRYSYEFVFSNGKLSTVDIYVK
ncbi:hypothetical protein SAMN05446037_102812 [Anaerovirgula multivorans]|uniref:Uncharacterized protein n=1 Tax=Anaerovirgula multivorans TaxID=312168 RepID=A0A239IHT2_9FIRM|nr:hypothetical protein [Anaerovirgula multivorans]SNS92818.1 hypothetical protein SAMN05446037_102812 [Anaerovirgula multivorans]